MTGSGSCLGALDEEWQLASAFGRKQPTAPLKIRLSH